MTLQDLFDQLSDGELAQVWVAERDANGLLTDAKRKALAQHINAGMTALHKRFFIKERRLTVTLQPDTFTYVLSSKYAVSNARSTAPVKYISDAADPFKDDLLQIEQVLDDAGTAQTLNKASDLTSIRTPNYRTLQLPARVENVDHVLDTSVSLEVVYRANHPKIDDSVLVYPDEMTEIDLPDMYLEPLGYYVASRVMNPMAAADGFHSGNNYMAKYEASCRQLENEGYDVTGTDPGEGFERAGWV